MHGLETSILYISLFTSLFFEIVLLITWQEVKKEIKFEEEHLKKPLLNFPSVSVIVPSFNEEATVEATVRSLLALDYPADKLTLLLIDDGSTDRTLEVLNMFKDEPRVKIFTKQNEGSKFAALNFALKVVDSDLVGCLDADSFVDSQALKKIVPFFEDAEVMAVTPSIKVHEPKTVLQHVQKIEYAWGVFLRRMLSSMGALYVTPGPFSIFRTRVFEELGGYKHAHHTEDMELALRMQKNRYKIVTSLGAEVYTVTPPGLGSLYKQRVRWTYGFLNNAIDYKDMYFKRKYGNISIFILPIATLSIFFTMFTAGNFLWGAGSAVYDAIVKYRVTGVLFHLSAPSFNWFFYNTGFISILTTMTLFVTLGTLFLALKTSEGKFRPGKALAYYLTLYVFIVPLWVSKALYNTIFSKKISWR